MWTSQWSQGFHRLLPSLLWYWSDDADDCDEPSACQNFISFLLTTVKRSGSRWRNLVRMTKPALWILSLFSTFPLQKTCSLNCQSRLASQFYGFIYIWDTFSSPLMIQVSSAVPKKVCSVAWNAAELPCCTECKEEWPGSLRVGSKLRLPVVNANCSSFPIAAGLESIEEAGMWRISAQDLYEKEILVEKL